MSIRTELSMASLFDQSTSHKVIAGTARKRPATTTKANTTDRLTRIYVDEVPNMLQNTVRITRKLGK